MEKRFDFFTVPELSIELGTRLRQQRLLKNFSQEDLASQSGLGISTIQRFE